ncbi:MAG: ATP-binding protein, partial [Saprospiraceae bacterium]
MARGLFVSHKIEERSYIAFVKKEIQYIVAQANFKPGRAGEIDIIVSELTSNVVKHAGRGELLYQLYWENDVSILELICLDRGPGMNNVPQMMRDGISTTNTLGQGLGAIERLSDV